MGKLKWRLLDFGLDEEVFQTRLRTHETEIWVSEKPNGMGWFAGLALVEKP